MWHSREQNNKDECIFLDMHSEIYSILMQHWKTFVFSTGFLFVLFIKTTLVYKHALNNVTRANVVTDICVIN
jgi:hypothetical protein